ncbi:hypothetical protein BH09PAT3_BH09PAT3_5300 [soil metagenome]
MVKEHSVFRTEKNRTALPIASMSEDMQQLFGEVVKATVDAHPGRMSLDAPAGTPENTALSHHLTDGVHALLRRCSGACIAKVAVYPQAEGMHNAGLEVNCFPGDFYERDAAEVQERACEQTHERAKVAFQTFLTQDRPV